MPILVICREQPTSKGDRLMSSVRVWRILATGTIILCCLQPAGLSAQEPVSPPEGIDHWAGIELAEAVSQSTGIAISPLLGVGALGAWTYFRVPEAQREQLPWFAQMWFWLPALILVFLLVAKDPLLGFLPIVKKPLDALDVVEDKISAVLASVVVIPMLGSVLSRTLLTEEVAGWTTGSPHLLTIVFPAFLSGAPGKIVIALAVVGLMAAFFVTWLAAHTINVLILLSPFGPLDTLLRAMKGLVLMTLVIATLIAPALGLVVSIVIVLVAWKVAGWSFRFTVFGSVLAWDILGFRSRRIDPAREPMVAFSGPDLVGAKPRTYGVIENDVASGPCFAFRPWLILPATRLSLPVDELEVGKGLFTPIMLGAGESEDESQHLVRFPPRFTGHEEVLAERLGARRVRLLGVRRQLGSLKDWVWDLFDRSAKAVDTGVS
jgi:hypothetical protein